MKRLSEMMTKPQKLSHLRLVRLARYHLVGTDKLVLRFDHQEYGDTVRIAVDSGRAGSEERYSTHAGVKFHGEHLTLHLSTAVCIIQGKECLRVIHVLNLSSLVVSASVARTIRCSF